MDALNYLAEQTRQINIALDQYTSSDRGYQPDLLEAMRYSLMGGGKRLRPVLVIAAAELFGAPAVQVIPAACAVEMIHTYSLIHDDLPSMDDDDLRRGRPTNHKVYGEGMATLAGDALLTLAFDLLAEQAEVPGVTAKQALRAIREIAHGAGPAGMVAGQVEDMAWEGRRADLDQLRRIHRLKTGALFTASLRAGAVLAGAGEADLDQLDRFAGHFGLAFQIQDDVLDVIGDAVKTGKGVGRDARHEKSTYVALLGLEGAQERARQEIEAAHNALALFGERGATLRTLAKFVVAREG